MAVKKQPEPGAGELSESATDWFRQFLKNLEIFMAETGQGLRPDSESVEYCHAAMRSVKLTLLDSGMDEEEIVNLFGRIAIEETNAPTKPAWNAELNKRRFELIDRDIQGTLSRVELVGLTHLMREHVDSEDNLPASSRSKAQHPAVGPKKKIGLWPIDALIELLAEVHSDLYREFSQLARRTCTPTHNPRANYRKLANPATRPQSASRSTNRINATLAMGTYRYAGTGGAS